LKTLGELFKEAHAKHEEFTKTNNLKGLESLIGEYENLLNHAPDELAFIFGLATIKLQLGFHGSAIALLQTALINHPDVPELWNNLGSAWKGENQNDKARECFEKALALRDDADYYNNLCTLHVNEGDPVPGEEWARKGLESNPDHPRLHWNLSLCLLEQGKWEEGFVEYDYGLHSLDRPHRNYGEGIDWWDGTPGQKVVVYGEQGIGDEIMYASCIPDLMKDCKVVFDCHDRMEDLMKRSFRVKCYPTRKSTEITWPHKENLDAKVAIGSLFRFYRPDGNFPKKPYLKPDPKKVRKYRKKLKKLGPGPYIGVAWQAGHKKTRNDLRSLKLSWLNPIFAEGGDFISLQYSAGALEKTERFFEDTGTRIHHWPDVVETGPDGDRYPGMNYDETVALVEALDLVICPNTTLVHLCGAIGKECWTITPKAAAWRYQLEGAHMPFYGDWVTQFREEGSWEDTIGRVAEEYARWRRDEAA
jgi:tetratricopeptide (TPR) repeat protein